LASRFTEPHNTIGNGCAKILPVHGEQRGKFAPNCNLLPRLLIY